MEKFNSITLFLTAAYEIGYRDKQLYKQMGDRGFDILKKEHLENRNKAYSVNVIRFLTSLNRVLGLGHFSLENYMLFRFEKIKPLFTIEAMRLFW